MSNPKVIPGSFALVSYKEISKTDKQSFLETIGAHLLTHFNVDDDLKIDMIKISPYHSSWTKYDFTVFEDVNAMAKLINMMSGYQMDCIPNLIFDHLNGFPDNPKTPNDPFFSRQWGLTNTKTDQVWGDSYYALGSDVKVGIMDTGVDVNQPDLQKNLREGYNCTAIANGDERHIIYYLSGLSPGYEPDYKPSRDVPDNSLVGHGTAVAGIIGATTNNEIGIAGVAPLVSMIPFKVSNELDGLIHALAVLAGLALIVEKSRKHTSNVVDILNCSFGNTFDFPDEFYIMKVWQDTVTLLLNKMVNDLGILCIVSAGNDGDRGNPTKFPAVLETTISVGSIDPTNQRSDFSSYGNDWVNIAAPGNQIYTTLKGSPGFPYGPMSGTSFAAPFVSGIAALVLSYARKRLSEQHVSLNNPQIAEFVTRALYQSATQTPELQPAFQYGKVNALGAIQWVDNQF